MAVLAIASAITFTQLGCGGEQGGQPTGIAGALTNAKVRISSFSLTTGTNTLPPDVEALVKAQNLQGLKGALYPTRNSKSFRLIVKGAGQNREDVAFYFDIRTKASDTGGNGKLVDSLTVAQGTDVPNPTNPPKHSSDYLFPVRKSSKDNRYYFTDDSTKPLPTSSKTYAIPDAGIYESDGASPLRSGARDVVVEFFAQNAQAVQLSDPLSTAVPPALPSDAAVKFRNENLTNVYVFSANIAPQNGTVDLTSGFQANNGDNGLIDSAAYKVKVSELPGKWKSVLIDAVEEKSPFSNAAITYQKVINRDNLPTDAQLDSNGVLTATVLVPNRQRTMRLYLSCYSDVNGSGVLLGQTDGGNKSASLPSSATDSYIEFLMGPDASVFGKDAKEVTFLMKPSPALGNLNSRDILIDFAKRPVTDISPLQLSFVATVYPWKHSAFPDANTQDVSSVNISADLLSISQASSTNTDDSEHQLWPVDARTTPSNHYVVLNDLVTEATNLGAAQFSFVSGKSLAPKDLFVNKKAPPSYKGAVALYEARFASGEGDDSVVPFAVEVKPNKGAIGGGTIK